MFPILLFIIRSWTSLDLYGAVGFHSQHSHFSFVYVIKSVFPVNIIRTYKSRSIAGNTIIQSTFSNRAKLYRMKR